MRIEVFDVAADRGGALTMLRGFYEAALQTPEHEWIFHVSTPQLPETENIRVHNHPWVKRSWFHRLYFESIANRFVRQAEPDVVVSLQNIGVWGAKVAEVVYVHQSLPFSADRYGLLDEPRLWAYQNIVSRLIKRSILKARVVIVQSQWMKRMIVERLHVDPDKIRVIPPPSVSSAPSHEPTDAARRCFFYPSSFMPYKNHKLIVEACRLLYEKGKRDFHVELTISPRSLKSLKANHLDCISTSGPLTFEEVQLRYSHTVLLYPSKLESYGLPLAEARRVGAIILASDTPSGREILDGYPNARLFAHDSAPALARLMGAVMDGDLEYLGPDVTATAPPSLRAQTIDAIVNHRQSTKITDYDTEQSVRTSGGLHLDQAISPHNGRTNARQCEPASKGPTRVKKGS